MNESVFSNYRSSEVVLGADDRPVEPGLVVVIEGHGSRQKNVRDHPYRPEIHRISVRLPHQDLCNKYHKIIPFKLSTYIFKKPTCLPTEPLAIDIFFPR